MFSLFVGLTVKDWALYCSQVFHSTIISYSFSALVECPRNRPTKDTISRNMVMYILIFKFLERVLDIKNISYSLLVSCIFSLYFLVICTFVFTSFSCVMIDLKYRIVIHFRKICPFDSICECSS